MSNDRQRGGRRPGRSGGGGGRGGSGGRGGGGHKPSRPKSSGGPVEPLHPTEDVPDIENFRHWELREEIFEVLDADNIVKPTPIQAIAISHVLAGKDVIARAQTGTGKTLAFAAPMLTRLDPTRSSVLALILSPTRELAEQIGKVFAALGEKIGLKVALIVGGEPAQPQVAALQAGAQIVVGTPGRVLDLYGQKFLSFPWTEIVVLDEADEMLEIGFIDDIKEILSKTPDERQTLLFSATFPTQLLKLARDYTRDPVEMATVSGHATADTVKQSWFKVDREEERPMAILRMLEQSEPEEVFLVFCDRRVEVERLFRKLERSSFSIKALHGGYEQEARFRVMDAFRGKEVKALIATDVASRGLDVKHVTHVINCGAPRNITGYTHRVGRTGRAGREGKAISIIAPPNMRNWKPILDQATWPIEEVSAPERTRQGGGGGGRDRGSRSNQGARSSRDNQRSRDGRDGRGDREGRGRDADRGNRDDRRARGSSDRGGGGEGQSGESRGGGRRRERSSERGDSRPGEQRTEQKSGDTPRDERPRRRRERSEDGGSGRPSDGERGSRRSRRERSESEQSKSDGGRERAPRPSKRPTAPPAAPGGFGDGV